MRDSGQIWSVKIIESHLWAAWPALRPAWAAGLVSRLFRRLAQPGGIERAAALVPGTPARVELKPGQVLSFGPEWRGCRLVVLSGVLWLTETPAREDLLAARGGAFCLDRHFPLVAEAVGRAEIEILRTP